MREVKSAFFTRLLVVRTENYISGNRGYDVPCCKGSLTSSLEEMGIYHSIDCLFVNGSH